MIPREHWLADYERLVMPVDLAPPQGWSDMAGFLADLRSALEALHTTQLHPAEQTLRGGTQTRGITVQQAPSGDPGAGGVDPRCNQQRRLAGWRSISITRSSAG